MSDQDTMARTVYGEARGEGYTGMQAVANVIMNRVNHPRWWGDDIESVCRTPWQFSCWNPADPNLSIIEAMTDADPIFSECLLIAGHAIAGELPDITGDATSYFDKRISSWPAWSDGRTPSATIGHHIFFIDV